MKRLITLGLAAAVLLTGGQGRAGTQHQEAQGRAGTQHQEDERQGGTQHQEAEGRAGTQHRETEGQGGTQHQEAGSIPGSRVPEAPRPQVPGDTLTASDALLRMPAKTLDILTRGMRLDLLDYYRADSIYRVPNALEGFSYLHRPLTDDYVKVQVTPVTTFTIRLLPRGKNRRIIVTLYTIGDSLQAADSEIRFYDTALNELKRDKFFKPASTEDFLDLKGVDRKKRDELLRLVPFPTVEYTLSPDGTDMKARLTVGEFLGREDLATLEPYLRRDRIYRWTGSRYEMQ